MDSISLVPADSYACATAGSMDQKQGNFRKTSTPERRTRHAQNPQSACSPRPIGCVEDDRRSSAGRKILIVLKDSSCLIGPEQPPQPDPEISSAVPPVRQLPLRNVRAPSTCRDRALTPPVPPHGTRTRGTAPRSPIAWTTPEGPGLLWAARPCRWSGAGECLARGRPAARDRRGPELLLTGRTLRDQGLMVTGLLDAGWPVPVLLEVIARPLPDPLLACRRRLVVGYSYS